MKYAVLGSGAMGFRYGVMLQENAGVKVDFVDAWEPNIEAVKKQGGVRVQRDHENEQLIDVNIYSPETYDQKPDVWLVFAKQMELQNLLERCQKAGLFNDNQYVVSAMNGIGHMDKIVQFFEKNNVLGGTAMIATLMPEPGFVDFMGKEGKESMHLATYGDNKPDDNQKQIMADLESAKLHPIYSEDYLSMAMTKLLFNSVVNTICTMFEIPMGQFGDFKGAKEMTTQMMDEAFEACKRNNINLPQTKEEAIQGVLDGCVDYKYHHPSMYQDLSKNRPTEVDYINGYIVSLGDKVGYNCAVHRFIVNEVHLAESIKQAQK
ncbi:ketopantoate reductase family protein [Holzapfeliella floricola]|nr:2-dehydropantoate 2-reductase [Holzapfeliella floricola]